MSRPRTEQDDRVHTAMRFPRDLHGRLAAAAAERGVGANWLATRLIAEGLDRLIPVDELVLTRAVPVQEKKP